MLLDNLIAKFTFSASTFEEKFMDHRIQKPSKKTTELCSPNAISVSHIPVTVCMIQKASRHQNYLVTDSKFPRPFISHPIVKAQLSHGRDVLHCE